MTIHVVFPAHCVVIPADPGIQYSLFMVRQSCVYLLASRRNGTLYAGVTSDPVTRVWEHKNDAVEGFTKRYRVHTLVWFELHETVESAIEREKSDKGMEAKVEARSD